MYCLLIVTFIKTKHPIQPVDLVHRILSDLERDQKSRTRYTSRLLPVQKTCLADTEKMQNLASRLLVPVMDAPADDGSLPSRTVRPHLSLKSLELKPFFFI